MTAISPVHCNVSAKAKTAFMTDALDNPTGADAVLFSLKANGVDYLFANAGSDFAPIIESYARRGEDGKRAPKPVIVPHEAALVAMAHGYYLVTGRPQAAMVHVNVGLANAVMGLINAHADDVPLIMMSGRTPLTEHDRPGARRTPIQYGQEQFDQSGMVCELVKWNYELRYAENAANLVSRGYAIAMSEPVGAVYLSLPREPLCEPAPALGEGNAPLQVAASPTAPDPQAIEQAAAWLATAKNPLIICQRGDPAGKVAALLGALAERHGIAVSEVFATRNVMPSDHPMLVGPNLAELLPAADVVLVVDAPVAWIESAAQPAEMAKVIHVGPDPLFARMPVRSYRTSLAIAGNTARILAALDTALDAHPPATRIRREAAVADHEAYRARVTKTAEAGSRGAASKAWVAHCVSEILGDEGIVFNERGAPSPFYTLKAGNRFFGNTPAGGLGWALPAALGAQLADRERLVVCVVGDGSYMFANPVVCHQVAEAHDLPLLTVILNNGAWDAVRLSTLEVYPEGYASRANEVPLSDLSPAPDYCAVAAGSRAWTCVVEEAGELPAALARAVAVVRDEQRQVVIDVRVRAE
ncbi:thiamine pyrophosphate-requiring protein [Nitratireductor sp.]|uniref:thiamine pyrophosphate-requiring protein n=1 Tax=Nitratireductor sp. TaxID=1872084 RepID=UPI0025F2ADC8|nr:thiamine pyrophosphate-requiring protein [Nitratireductor sp.]